MNNNIYDDNIKHLFDETNLPLKIGDSGDKILILHEKLKQLGYTSIPISNIFNEDLAEAVKKFQKDNNLSFNGIVDNATWERLFALTKSDFTPTPTSLTKPTLRVGSTGPYVVELQTSLAQMLYFTGSIDGVFGTSTESAVKAFQTVNKLTADGIVGRATWAALAYLYRPLAICGGEEEQPPSGRVVHTVQAGDTLFSIARLYGTTVDEIMRLNNLTSTTLRIGQELVISEGTEVTPPSGTNVYTVQSGDTLWSIANRFNTTVAELKRLNNLTSDVLSIGQQLLVPSITSEENLFEYVVIAGDTLWSIARNYDTTVAEIRRLNNLASDVLSIGQILLLPRTTEVQYVTYVVRAGDTLFGLARNFNSTVAAIREINNLTSDIINVGRTIIIPVNIT